jgi:hypothetical protein
MKRRMALPWRLVPLLIAGSLCGGAQAAELVEIAWGSAQRFELQRRIEAGKVLEVCGPLAAGQAVDWQFVANRPLAFNIHHHVGRKAEYAVRRQRSKGMTSRFTPAEAADYCWMWTAPKDQAVQMQLLLRH